MKRPASSHDASRDVAALPLEFGAGGPYVPAAPAAASGPMDIAPYFQALVEHASDIILLIDATGIVRYMSPSGERVLGHPTHQLVGTDGFALVHPDDAPRTRESLAAAIDEPGCIRSIEIRLRHRDGSWREVESIGKAVHFDGLGDHVVITARDITERRAIERALTASEERYRRFFEEDVAGHVISTADGRIIDCNSAFATMFGFDSAEEARRANMLDLYPDAAARKQFLARLTTERRVERLQMAMRRRDGHPVYVLTSAIAEFDKPGRIRCIRGQLLNETTVRLLTSQIHASRRIEALGLLAGGVAHDFNNILTTILGHAQIALNRTPTESPLVQNLGEILRAGERAAALTRQLLAVGRRQFLAPQRVSLHDIVADVRPMLTRIVGDDVELRAVRGAGATQVLVDASQIDQVIMNLVINARDAMPGGGLVVIATRECVVGANAPRTPDGPPPGRYAVVAVTDGGVGMDAETRERIFDPFFTTKEMGRGTGLGLSIVHGIVHQSRGYITVESEPGHGSCFTVYLPLDHSEPSEPGRESRQESRARQLRSILLVEDEEPVRRLLAAVLEDAGYRVTEAEDGKQALDLLSLLESGQPDLIITDLMMPNLGGRKFAELARQILPMVPVLFISGYHQDLSSDSFQRDSDSHFLQKPFPPTLLLERVRDMLATPETNPE